jgi:hypothetical protein
MNKVDFSRSTNWELWNTELLGRLYKEGQLLLKVVADSISTVETPPSFGNTFDKSASAHSGEVWVKTAAVPRLVGGNVSIDSDITATMESPEGSTVSKYFLHVRIEGV